MDITTIAHLEPEQAETLRNLLWLHERAIRAYAFAKGLKAVRKKGRSEATSEPVLAELAAEAIRAESDLYNYIATLEK